MDVVRATGARVVLRHTPSGQVLSHGDSRPVGFADRASAETFRVRFLDETDAWEPIARDTGSACRAA